jgi:putative copper resistance protein D
VLTQLLDVFSFLSVLLRGGSLAFESLVLGGAAFSLWVLGPLRWKAPTELLTQSCRRLICWSAAALIVTQGCYVIADSGILAGAAGLGLSDITGANFFLAGSAAIVAGAAVALATARKTWAPSPGLLAPALVILGSLVVTSHAAARLEHRPVLCILTALHQAATASWVGGMPYLVLTLARSPDPAVARILCRRFSRLALISVAVLVATGTGMALAYVDSAEAIYKTTYGAMVASKVILLLLLLCLGALNFFILRQPIEAGARLLPSLRRFAEAEVGIGFTVILAAASLTSQPPAVDLQNDRVSGTEILARMSPHLPSFETPQYSALSPVTPLGFDEKGEPGLMSFVPGTHFRPNLPGDIAWSEYNHHWAGLIVAIVGLLATLAQSGIARWARHWPLAFIGLAVFLFLRADPENWPLGPRSFWQSFAVAEVLQHRIFVLLIVAFAGFEWSVRTGRITSRFAAAVFPAVCATSGALLLTHSHPLSNSKEALLVELSHIPLAIFAVIAGWSRRLELSLPASQQRIPAWIWPICFVLIGVVLLNYREH